MASLDQLKTALRNAEAKGATQDAALLANAIKERTPAPARDRAAEEAARNLQLAQLQPGSFGQGIAEFGKGILGGAAGILETGAIGAADFFVPDAFDDPVREGIQSTFDVVQEPLAPRANVGVGATAIPRKFGEALGSFGGILGASLVNPLAGGTLAVTAGMGEAVERAREAGATPAERARASILGGVVGASELLPVGLLLGRFSKNVGGELAKGYIEAGKRVFKQAGAEGLQEFGANVGQNLIEQGIYNPEQGTFEGSQESFGYGAGVGGFVQAFAEMVAPRVRARGTPTPTEEPDITDQIQDLDQGELFKADVNLGQRAGVQQELFDKDTNLGTAPSPRPSPQAPKDPRQQEMDFGAKAKETQLGLFDKPLRETFSEDIAKNEQIAQAAARERQGLAAAERDDVKAFEQPELFALEREQDERKYGKPTPKKPIEATKPISFADLSIEDRRLINTAPIEVKEKLTSELIKLQQEKQKRLESEFGRGRDLVDVMDEESALAEGVAKEEAQLTGRKALVAEAEAESAMGRIETTRDKQSKATRTKILQDTVANTGIRKPVALQKEFESALVGAGIAQDKATPDEIASIKRASSVIRAQDPRVAEQEAVAQKAAAKAAGQEAKKDPRQIAMEARVAPKERGKPDGRTDTTGSGVGVSSDRSGVAVPPAAPVGSTEKVTTPAAAGLGRPDASVDRTDVREGPEASALEFKKLPREQRKAFQRRLADMYNLRRKKTYLEYEKTKDSEALKKAELKNRKSDTGVLIDISFANPKEYYDALPKEQKGIYNAAPENEKGKVLAELSIPDVEKKPEPKPVAKKPFSFDPAVAERLKKGEAFRKAEDARKTLELEKKEVKDIVSKEQKEAFLADRKGLEAVDKKDLDKEFKQNFDRTATPEIKKFAEDFVPETSTLVRLEKGMDITGEQIDKGRYQEVVKLKDPTTAKDTRVILDLVTGKTKGLSKNKEAQEAKKYFSKVVSVHQGIENLIHDAIYATKRYRKEDLLKQKNPEIDPEILKSGKKKLAAGFAEAKLYDVYREGTSATAAERAIKFLKDSKDISESTKKYIRERLVEEGDKRTDTNEALDRKDVFRYLPTAEINTLSFSLHPEVKNSLYAGNLKDALKNVGLTESLPKEITNLAKKLGDRAGTTKIKVNPKIKKGISGLFNPKTNTIEIDPASGMNSHVLLHEVTHAVTAATLANKSHPLTKQLTALYNDVKPYLSTGYGTQSLDEFVAETFSNHKFQQELASISIKGQPVRALQRFFNSVVNFLRRMIGLDTVPLTALESASPLIEAIMAPAPEFRDAGALLMRTPDGLKDIGKNIERTVKDIRKGAPSTFEEIYSFIFDSKIAGMAKDFFLGFTDALTVGELGKFSGMGDIGIRINNALNAQRGGTEAARGRFSKAYESILEARNSLLKLNENGMDILDTLIYSPDFGATVYQVDPTKTKQDYQKTKKGVTQDKFDSSGNNLREIWQKQQDYLKQNSKERALVESIFNKMRTHYRSEYTTLKKVLGKQIDDALGKDSNEAKQLKKNVFDKIFDMNTLDVYFPYIREGDYSIKYLRTDADGDPDVFELVSTKNAQDARIQELLNDPNVDPKSIKSYNNSMNFSSSFKTSPPTTFVGNTLDVLEKKAGKDNRELINGLKEDITNLFIQTLPETSFARSLQKRRGVKGFIANSMQAFEMKGLNLPTQVAKLEGTANLRALENELTKIREDKAEEKSQDFGAKKLFSKDTIAPEVDRITNELKKRLQFGMFGAQNKSLEKGAKTLNQFAFLYTIGFNVSSAVVNLSQVPLFAYPYLSAQHGFKSSYKAISDAYKLTAGSRNAVDKYFDENYKVKDEYKKIIRDKSETVAEADAEIASLQEYGPLIKLAAERGQLTPTFLFDAQGLQESEGLKRGFLERMVAFSAIPFNQAERFNRQAILMASYKLALKNTDTTYGENKEKTFNNPELAAQYAIDQTQKLNGGTVLETGPRFAQQHIGRVALMYKSYGLRMYTTMLQSAIRAVDTSNLTKEERSIARKQILYTHGSALAMAGVYGLPLYGAVKMVMDMFYDDEELDFDARTRQFFGEELYKGGLNQLLGVDVASRIRLSGLLLQENRFNPDASFEEEVFFYFGGPAISTVKRSGRAIKDFNDGEFWRGVESALPAGVSNMTARLGRLVSEGGYKTRRGDAIFTDNTLADYAGTAFGFSPIEYTTQMDINNDLKNIDKNIGTKKSKLLKKYYTALRENNYDDLKDITEDITEWNKKYAQDKKVQISTKTIQRSMKAHEARSKNIELYGGVNIINTSIIDQLKTGYD